MEIKKADSKGRITGFEPGRYYFIDRESGTYWAVEQVEGERVGEQETALRGWNEKSK